MFLPPVNRDETLEFYSDRRCVVRLPDRTRVPYKVWDYEQRQPRLYGYLDGHRFAEQREGWLAKQRAWITLGDYRNEAIRWYRQRIPVTEHLYFHFQGVWLTAVLRQHPPLRNLLGQRFRLWPAASSPPAMLGWVDPVPHEYRLLYELSNERPDLVWRIIGNDVKGGIRLRPDEQSLVAVTAPFFMLRELEPDSPTEFTIQPTRRLTVRSYP